MAVRRKSNSGQKKSGLGLVKDSALTSSEELSSSVLKAELETLETAQGALDKVILLLRDQTGHDFSGYKRTTFLRRIERRMGIHQIDSLEAYVRYLRGNSQELDLLFKELLIGVTRFFRDPAVWEKMRNQVFPELLAARSSKRTVRAWVPGCSTGEEVYTLAMVFKEALDQIQPNYNFSLQIFATDLDPETISRARQGIYPESIAADVSPERLDRFFKKEELQYRVNKEIREMVIFAPQNLIMDPPFIRLDVLSCRNLLIYLNGELQDKLMPLFHHCLNPDGTLILGSAETVGLFTNLFHPLSAKLNLYRRKQTRPHLAVGFPISFPHAFLKEAGESLPAKPSSNIQTLINHVLLQRYSPPGVLVSAEGDLLYVSGKTGRYLEPAAGKANLNIFAMAREGLRYELASVFKQALLEKTTITRRGIKVKANGESHLVDLTVQAFNEPEVLRGTALIIFAEAKPVAKAALTKQLSKASAKGLREVELEKELERALQEALAMRQDMQTSQEDLKSMNEEMQSSNEELQSTNEELTTSKEEMQSMNEELQTVNSELSAKLEALSGANTDMENLLDSIDTPTVFLDKNLHIVRFTFSATQLIKLIPSDIGRPLTDLTSDIQYSNLAKDAHEVLRTLARVEKEVNARDGRWFLVRFKPFRIQDNRVDGLVVTFTDITRLKLLTAELKQAKEKLQCEKTSQATGRL